VDCNFTLTIADCPTANQFNIKVLTGNGSSLIFNGSGSGIPLKINPPFPAAYHTAETNAPAGFVVATIPVGITPTGIAFNPNNLN
jgi:hypothetical protein